MTVATVIAGQVKPITTTGSKEPATEKPAHPSFDVGEHAGKRGLAPVRGPGRGGVDAVRRSKEVHPHTSSTVVLVHGRVHGKEVVAARERSDQRPESFVEWGLQNTAARKGRFFPRHAPAVSVVVDGWAGGHGKRGHGMGSNVESIKQGHA